MSSPTPNPQRFAPLLPRLLWRELHLLAPLWIALYALGATLFLVTHLTSYPIAKPSDIVEMTLSTTGFVSGIFLVTSLLVTFSLERENHEDLFSLHRGLPLWPIVITKTLLPVKMFLAMIAILTITGFFTANLSSSFSLRDAIHAENYSPSNRIIPTIFWLAFLAFITSSWTILFSLATRKVIHALLLTFAAIIANIIYLRVITESIVPPVDASTSYTWTQQFLSITITSLPLIVTAFAFRYLRQRPEPVFNRQLFGTHTPKLIPLTTNPPPIEISTWQHLRWLHLREQHPLLIAASIVIITAAIQPMLTTYNVNEVSFSYMERYPFYLASCLFLLFSGTLTFAPEHTHSQYRFWYDRGLSTSLIFRSRILRFSLILLTTLCISFFVFTTTDALINHNNSLLTAFDSGTLFQIDDDIKSAPLFVAQYLLTAIPVAVFWSWICRHLIMSIVMTAFSMLFCFAYGNWGKSNDWPYLVTHAPFLIATIACLWTLFPERFRAQPRLRLWLIPTLAAPLALLISLSDIAFYRVVEIPYIFQSAGDSEPYETRQSTVVTSNNDTFTTALTTISHNLKPAPIPDLGSLATIEHNFKVECFGWSHLHPDLQAWTQQNRNLAIQLQLLLTDTPISEMTVPITNTLDPTFQLAHLQTLLIYHAKLSEHEGNRGQAWQSYVAADRFAEFTTMFNSAYIDSRLLFRATVTRHLASFVADKNFNRDQLTPFIRFGVERLPDAPYAYIQRHRTFNQLHNLDIPTGYNAPFWTHLPTERWRYQRLLAHWIEDLNNRNVQLYRLSDGKVSNYIQITYGLNDSYKDIQRSWNLLHLQDSTPIFGLYGGYFDWSVDPVTDLQNDHSALVQLTNAQSRLLILIAERESHQPITSINQVNEYFQKSQFARTLQSGEKKDEAILKFLAHNRIDIYPNTIDSALVPSLPKRIIQSTFIGERVDFPLPLPDVVPLTLVSEDH